MGEGKREEARVPRRTDSSGAEAKCCGEVGGRGGPHLEIILSVITFIPTGQEDLRCCQFPCSYLGQPPISFQAAAAAAALSSIREEAGRHEWTPERSGDEITRASFNAGEKLGLSSV